MTKFDYDIFYGGVDERIQSSSNKKGVQNL